MLDQTVDHETEKYASLTVTSTIDKQDIKTYIQINSGGHAHCYYCKKGGITSMGVQRLVTVGNVEIIGPPPNEFAEPKSELFAKATADAKQTFRHRRGVCSQESCQNAYDLLIWPF